MKYKLKWIHKPSGKSWVRDLIFDNVNSAETVIESYMSDDYFKEFYEIVPIPVQEQSQDESRD